MVAASRTVLARARLRFKAADGSETGLRLHGLLVRSVDCEPKPWIAGLAAEKVRAVDSAKGERPKKNGRQGQDRNDVGR